MEQVWKVGKFEIEKNVKDVCKINKLNLPCCSSLMPLINFQGVVLKVSIDDFWKNTQICI